MAVKCPYCSNDDKSLLEYLGSGLWLCNQCSKTHKPGK